MTLDPKTAPLTAAQIASLRFKRSIKPLRYAAFLFLVPLILGKFSDAVDVAMIGTACFLLCAAVVEYIKNMVNGEYRDISYRSHLLLASIVQPSSAAKTYMDAVSYQNRSLTYKEYTALCRLAQENN